MNIERGKKLVAFLQSSAGRGSAATLIDRLDRVRVAGPDRWLACCPAHEDRSPSLSIRQADARVLVHCFGGCETGDVLAAIGLSLADLFEKPIGHHVASSRSKIPARDLLELISAETSVIAIIAIDMLGKRSIDEANWHRLTQAAARIGRARDHAHGC